MSEQLDNELKNRINQVFDNYEDTAPAEEGWLLLREKFPEKKKQRILPIWWSAAAVFLLLSILGVWIYTQPVNNKIVTTKQINKNLQPAEQQIKLPADTLPADGTAKSGDNTIPATDQYAALSAKKSNTPSEATYKAPNKTTYSSVDVSTPQLATNALNVPNAQTATTLNKITNNAADSLKQANNITPVQQGVLAQQTVKD